MAGLTDFETEHFNFIQFREDKEHEKFTKGLRDREAMKYCKDMFYQGYKLVKNHRNPHDNNYFIVQDRQTGEFIGAVFISGLAKDNGRGISYAIDKDHRNQKYGSIMIAESILHLWENSTKNIYIYVRDDNEGSIGLAKKLGFKMAKKAEEKNETSKYVLAKTTENQKLLESVIKHSKRETTEIMQESQTNEETQLRQSISPKSLREASKTRFKDFCRQKFESLMSTLRNKAINRSKQKHSRKRRTIDFDFFQHKLPL